MGSLFVAVLQAIRIGPGRINNQSAYIRQELYKKEDKNGLKYYPERIAEVCSFWLIGPLRGNILDFGHSSNVAELLAGLKETPDINDCYHKYQQQKHRHAGTDYSFLHGFTERFLKNAP